MFKVGDRVQLTQEWHHGSRIGDKGTVIGVGAVYNQVQHYRVRFDTYTKYTSPTDCHTPYQFVLKLVGHHVPTKEEKEAAVEKAKKVITHIQDGLENSFPLIRGQVTTTCVSDGKRNCMVAFFVDENIVGSGFSRTCPDDTFDLFTGYVLAARRAYADAKEVMTKAKRLMGATNV